VPAIPNSPSKTRLRSAGDAVRGDRCPQKGCAANVEPVVADDGHVYLNSCVAACYAKVVRGGRYPSLDVRTVRVLSALSRSL
jgi:hypothetical protein